MNRTVTDQPTSPSAANRPPRPRRRYSISGRLRWSYLISSTLPLLLVGILLIFINLRTQQQSVYTSQDLLAEQIARDISAYILGVESQLLRFGRAVRVDETPEAIAAAISSLISTNPDILELAVIDAAGDEVTRLSSTQVFAPEELRTRIDEPLVRAALQNGVGGRSTIYRTEDGRLVFDVVLPIRTFSEGIAGAVAAQVSGLRIEQLLRTPEEATETTAYLVDANHQVMVTGRSLDWRPPDSLEVLFTAPAGLAEYRGGNGQPVIGARALIRPNNWWVVVEQPLQVAFASVRRSVVLLGMLVTVVGLLALVWGLYQAQQLLRPLRSLRNGAMVLGAGELTHRIAVNGAEEMSELAGTFNQMAEQLQASRAAIEAQNEHLRHGLALARDIQMGLLPTNPPWSHDVLTVYARSLPAYEVGGDFYTYLALSGGRAAIAVGDISGKGVGAALLMALTSSMVEAQARQLDKPSEMLATLNRLLRPRLQSNHMNAALLMAVFDLHAGTITVSNAGMITPLLVRPSRRADAIGTQGMPEGAGADRATMFIETGGLPIGALAQARYQDVLTELQPGDIVLFVSDGVVEAQNESGELFGFERLEELVAHLRDGDLQLMVNQIVQAIQDFVGTAPQHDDITLVAVRPSLLRSDAGNTETMQRPEAQIPLEAVPRS